MAAALTAGADRSTIRRALAVLALGIVAGGGCDSSPSGSTDAPPATPTPAASTPPIPSPPPDVPPSPFPLTVACTASPRAGEVPLRVDFQAAAAGGRRTYAYAWSFGDGSEGSRNPNPSHAYETPGDYEATVTVADGAGTASCSRAIRATRPAPAPTTLHQLTVVAGGPGTLAVSSRPGSIRCNFPPQPADRCSEAFAHGTSIELIAARIWNGPGGVGVVWHGPCDQLIPHNNGVSCFVTLNADRQVSVSAN